jgi:signal transduction histidine kinase
MTDALLRKFRESLFEVYGNAVDHAETQLGIFACGQYYPRNQRLDFSIADLGIGIQERILKDLGVRMTPVQAINWAMEGNTTRRGRPGGLGLQLIREFLQLNGGRIVVVSASGYWELSKKHKGKPRTSVLHCAFPGTIVTIEVNAADKKSYRLRSEIDPTQIF